MAPFVVNLLLLPIVVIMASNLNGGYNFKVVLLGEGCVGKTSVALRYVEDKFNDKHITTLQVSPNLVCIF